MVSGLQRSCNLHPMFPDPRKIQSWSEYSANTGEIVSSGFDLHLWYQREWPHGFHSQWTPTGDFGKHLFHSMCCCMFLLAVQRLHSRPCLNRRASVNINSMQQNTSDIENLHKRHAQSFCCMCMPACILNRCIGPSQQIAASGPRSSPALLEAHWRPHNSCMV